MEYIKKLIFSNILLTIILLLAFSIRIYNLSNLPYGFFCDEASIGYNAYSVLATGRDEYQSLFPIFFRSLDDYRPPIQIYSAIPIVFILGLNEFSTRITSVLYGLLTLLSLYFIGKHICSKKLGLLAVFVGALMPWLIHYSRVGFEFSSYSALFTISTLLFVLSLHNKKYLIPAFIFSALTLYTYQPAKLLSVLLVIGVLIIYKRYILRHKKELITGIGIFLLLGIPLFFSIWSGTFFNRFNQVSILSFSNNPIFVLSKIFFNYIIQLDPNYLFSSGEPTLITRHFTNGFAPLLISTLPFLLLGLYDVFKNIRKNIYYRILILWLFLYPIAGAVTKDTPFTARGIIGAPLFAILIALGIIKLIQLTKPLLSSKLTTISILLIIIINFTFFLNFYFMKYPNYSSDFWGWQYGPRGIMSYFLQNKNKYDQLIIVGNFNAPYIFIKFYDPKNTCKDRCIIGDFNSYNPSLKQFFAVGADRINELSEGKLNIEKTLYYPNRKPAFYLGTISY